MKTLKKLIGLAVLTLGVNAYANEAIDAVINASATGTTSATAFIPAADGVANITDLGFRLDANVTTGTLGIRQGQKRFSVTSATSASGTQLWFDNSGGDVSALEYVILRQGTTYTLVRAKAATTTSITLDATLSPATTTSDYVWSTFPTVERPVATTTSATAALSLWLPANVPTALTVDGNTTSCRISASGVRSIYK